MGMFQQSEGDTVTVVERGVYRQTDLYTRNGYLYAKVGVGFVRLYADGSTSKHTCRIDEVSYEGRLYSDKFGKLCDPSVEGAKALPSERETLLLGKPTA